MSHQLDQYDIDPVFQCHLWCGKTDRRDGGAIIWRGAAPYAAYRAVWEQQVGPIADELVLDHLCRRRQCVNVMHLEPVTKAENEKRKFWRYRVRIAKCPRGHSMSDAMVTPEGGRLCRTCNRKGMP